MFWSSKLFMPKYGTDVLPDETKDNGSSYQMGSHVPNSMHTYEISDPTRNQYQLHKLGTKFTKSKIPPRKCYDDSIPGTSNPISVNKTMGYPFMKTKETRKYIMIKFCNKTGLSPD